MSKPWRYWDLYNGIEFHDPTVEYGMKVQVIEIGALRELVSYLKHVKAGLTTLKERDLGALGLYEFVRDRLKEIDTDYESKELK